MTQQITALPPAPDSNNPTTFNALANAFVAALPQFRTEANALAVEANNNTNTASTAATTATSKATAAATSETNALSYKNSAEVSANASANSASAAGASANAAATSAANAQLWDPTNYNVKAISNPIGSMIAWPLATAPNGWLICNGALVSRTTYAALFAVIGTIYGVGDGSTTFALPDYRNRFPVGAGSLYAAGVTGGSKDAIVVAHTHAVTDPGHSHSTNGTTYGGAPQGLVGGGNPYTASETIGTSQTGISINSTGSSATDANLPPYLGEYRLIKY